MDYLKHDFSRVDARFLRKFPSVRFLFSPRRDDSQETSAIPRSSSRPGVISRDDTRANQQPDKRLYPRHTSPGALLLLAGDKSALSTGRRVPTATEDLVPNRQRTDLRNESGAGEGDKQRRGQTLCSALLRGAHLRALGFSSTRNAPPIEQTSA